MGVWRRRKQRAGNFERRVSRREREREREREKARARAHSNTHTHTHTRTHVFPPFPPFPSLAYADTHHHGPFPFAFLFSFLFFSCSYYPAAEGLEFAEDGKSWSPAAVLQDGTFHHVVVEISKEVQVTQVTLRYALGYAGMQLDAIGLSDSAESGFVLAYKSDDAPGGLPSTAMEETVAVKALPFYAKRLNITFKGSDWVDVDAIKVVGLLTMAPTFTTNGGKPYEVTLPGLSTVRAPFPPFPLSPFLSFSLSLLHPPASFSSLFFHFSLRCQACTHTHQSDGTLL